MNMGDERPQGIRVRVGTAVNVGVSVGVRVAVLVACAVGTVEGTALVGAAQPDRTARNRSQKINIFGRGWVKWEGCSMVDIALDERSDPG
jgi:hypothetical protein